MTAGQMNSMCDRGGLGHKITRNIQNAVRGMTEPHISKFTPMRAQTNSEQLPPKRKNHAGLNIYIISKDKYCSRTVRKYEL